MKPFDLEKAKAGYPVINGQGYPTRIVCFDFKHGPYSILGVTLNPDGYEIPSIYTNKGKFYNHKVDKRKDLFMAVNKKSGWLNIYKSWHTDTGIAKVYEVYDTKQKADEFAYDGRVDCIHITWEE